MIIEMTTIALGLLVGLSLGMLGGGGSTLAVPILVFVGGMQAQAATTGSLFVVGLAAMIGALAHYRAGNVRLGVGLGFGAMGILGSRIGTSLNQSLSEEVLLLAFSALVIFVAFRMFRSVDGGSLSAGRGSSEHARHDESASVGGAGAATATIARTGLAIERTPAALSRLVLAASLVGLLTGLFGVGGGFAVVPALTLLVGFNAKQAIGTSLVVIAVNAMVALAMRSDQLALDWALIGPFLATVVLGVVVGTRLAADVDAGRLTRSFAVLLAIVGLYTAASALLG